jgi:hypothetical protein
MPAHRAAILAARRNLDSEYESFPSRSKTHG